MAKRMFVPRSVFVASAVGGGLVNLACRSSPAPDPRGRRAFRSTRPGSFLPVSIFIGALFTAGPRCILFTLASRFADIEEMYPVIVQTWFFLTPIVYHPSIVPPGTGSSCG